MPEKVPILTKEELSAELKTVLDELGKRLDAIEKQAQEVEQRQLAGITGFQIAGIPVGSAAVGGFIALLTSEVIDGLLAGRNVPEAFAKLIGAWAVKQWGSRWVGAEAAADAAKFLAFDAVRSFIPLDEWVQKISPFKKPSPETTQEQKQEQQTQQQAAPEDMDALFKLAAASGLG